MFCEIFSLLVAMEMETQKEQQRRQEEWLELMKEEEEENYDVTESF